ncbi:MAG: tRNA (N6-isopentenyl adenosine(37)-C2)-methylthiotransferase MiaB [Phycisphaerales bacterium]|nr:tRNA (N6-isopentenyl adenosine(37)-C2)-methylthiotransferase MiaB [Phycisphaerales bacterium]
MSADVGKLVYLETFGCQMNELDSELVTTQLRALGYRFTPDADEAGVILYNTCSVREQAEQKVWSRLGLMKSRKKRQPDLLLGVLGCMAERDGRDMLRKFPHVDLLCGPGELDKLPLLLRNASTTSEPAIALQGSTSRRSGTLAAAEDQLELLDLSRSFAPQDQRSAGRSAYVRITRGCNKFCTYCVVPFTRGAEMHRPPDHIVDECRALVERGVVEITLLGQTVNHYRFEHDAAVVVDGVVQSQKGRSFTGGHDRDPLTGHRVTTFADLLRRIHDEVPQLRRLRFVTSYPRDFGNDVLETIRDCPRICRYIHVPVQSGSNRILEAMNRGYSVEEYRDFIERIRAYLPDAMIASDVIVGFPGETEEDFEATADLMRWARFKNCFVFKYSPRPGTPAYDRLPDDVPDEVKRQRNNALLQVQGAISHAIHTAQIGRTLDVFVEGMSTVQARREPVLAGARGTVGLTLNGHALADDDGDCSTGCCTAAPPVEWHESPTVQLSGRTDGDLITVFDVPRERAASLVGQIVPVLIEESRTLTLKGRLAR